MSSRVWIRDGKIIRDAFGRVIQCDDCPCPADAGTGTGTGSFPFGTGTGLWAGSGTGGQVWVPCCPGFLLPETIWGTLECVSGCTSCVSPGPGLHDFSVDAIVSFEMRYVGVVAGYNGGAPAHRWDSYAVNEGGGSFIGLECEMADEISLLKWMMACSWTTSNGVFSSVVDVVCSPFFVQFSDNGADTVGVEACGSGMTLRPYFSEIPP